MQLVLPADWFPLNRPGFPEYIHILYNITAPLILLKVSQRHNLSLRTGKKTQVRKFQLIASFLLLQMLERSLRMLPRLAVHLGIITVVMGTSLHLVADSIIRRLLLIGYQLQLSVRENPAMKNLEPSVLVDSEISTGQTSPGPGPVRLNLNV